MLSFLGFIKYLVRLKNQINKWSKLKPNGNFHSHILIKQNILPYILHLKIIINKQFAYLSLLLFIYIFL